MLKKSIKSLLYTILLLVGFAFAGCSGTTTPSSVTDNGLTHEEGGSINHDDGDAIAYFLCEEMCNYYDETVKLVFYPNNKFALRATILDTIIKTKNKDDDNYECELYGQRYDKYRGTYEGDPTKDGKLIVNFTEKGSVSLGPDEGTYTTIEEAFNTAEWHLHIEYEPYENTTADIKVSIKDDVVNFSNGPISYYEFTRTDSEDLGPYHYDGVPRRQNNNKRTEWSIPEGYTSVASCCFYRSSSAESDYYKYLKKVHLPSTIKKIGSRAFNNCTGLEEINIPSACKVIESKAFYNCVSLKEITIPKCIEKIGSSAFGKEPSNDDEEEEKPSILVVKFEDGTTEIPENACSAGDYYYTSYKSLITKVVIPSSVKKIGKNAFCNLVLSEPVEIPEGVEEIGETAFYIQKNDAPVIEKFTLPSTVKTVGKYAFQNIKIKKLVLSEGVESIGDYAFYWSNSSSDDESFKGLEELEIPASLKELDSSTFNLYNLKTLKYGSTLPNLQKIKGKLNFNTDSSMTSTIICNGEDVTEFYKNSLSTKLGSYYDSYTWKNDSIELVLNYDKTYTLKNGNTEETGCVITIENTSEDTSEIIFYPSTGSKKTYNYTCEYPYNTLTISGLGTLTKSNE